MKRNNFIFISILFVAIFVLFVLFFNSRDFVVKLESKSEANPKKEFRSKSDFLVENKRTKSSDKRISNNEMNQETKESAFAHLADDLMLSFRFRSNTEFIEVDSSDKALIENMTDEEWGTYIGVELVGKDGESLTNLDPAYKGIHYNRSVMIMPDFSGNVASGRVRMEVPEIQLSIEKLLSDIKHILREPRNLKTLSQEGVRIRFREVMSFPKNPDDSVSEWIVLDENTRRNLINYLITDSMESVPNNRR